MERTSTPLQGAGLNGSPLAGLLSQLALIDRSSAVPSFIEGMGRWLDWKHAIALSAVLQAPLATPTRQAPTGAGVRAMQAEFMRVQSVLTQDIADQTSACADDGGDCLSMRRRCTGLQQTMEAAIQPLRVQLREALVLCSPELSRLAALDAVMASVLSRQEQAQLAQLPGRLEKHFKRLRLAHAESTGQASWPRAFCQDMQRMLLAELALRLQPALGLLQTLQGTAPRTS